MLVICRETTRTRPPNTLMGEFKATKCNVYFFRHASGSGGVSVNPPLWSRMSEVSPPLIRDGPLTFTYIHVYLLADTFRLCCTFRMSKII